MRRLRLQLVTDASEHQFTEAPGVLPGTPGTACRYCGEESPHHIARQCGGGVSVGLRRCEADAIYMVPWAGRRIPFCGDCAARTIDLAMAFGLPLTLEPIAGGTS